MDRHTAPPESKPSQLNFASSVQRGSSPLHGAVSIGSALLGTAFVAIILTTQPGCLGLYSNLMHAVGADKVPAEYEGLEDSRVAIVTVTDSSQYSNDTSARILSRRVGELLLSEIDDLTLIREDLIEQWRDKNGWDSIDFVEIGKGVKADKLLGIEVTNLRLRDGATLYRGRADVTISVIDVATGDVLYRRELEEFTFPTNAGQYTSETTEPRFRKLYLGMLAKQISRSFYPWDFSETIAIDGSIASH
tara:strand:+ start:172586 stop:173329 length:744 start_codon:yes stop_codon:yes gene_type:complete